MSVVRLNDLKEPVAARWIAHADALRCGTATDSVTLSVSDGVLDIRTDHEPRGDDLVRCLQQALDWRTACRRWST